jgi:hypothetical protein
LEVASLGRFHATGDSVLGLPELPPEHLLFQGFEGDILKSVPLKKLGRCGVYFS